MPPTKRGRASVGGWSRGASLNGRIGSVNRFALLDEDLVPQRKAFALGPSLLLATAFDETRAFHGRAARDEEAELHSTEQRATDGPFQQAQQRDGGGESGSAATAPTRGGGSSSGSSAWGAASAAADGGATAAAAGGDGARWATESAAGRRAAYGALGGDELADLQELFLPLGGGSGSGSSARASSTTMPPAASSSARAAISSSLAAGAVGGALDDLATFAAGLPAASSLPSSVAPAASAWDFSGLGQHADDITRRAAEEREVARLQHSADLAVRLRAHEGERGALAERMSRQELSHKQRVRRIVEAQRGAQFADRFASRLARQGDRRKERNRAKSS